jgi:hypothetical protein
MKTGRNDPCPCGSGKKFKKCCLGKKQPALSGTRHRSGLPLPPASPSRSLDRTKPSAPRPVAAPRPRSPAEERWDTVWKEFESQHGEERKAVFLRELDDKELMTDGAAFEMLSRLHQDAVEHGERARFGELVGALAERLSDVYEQSAHFYLSWQLQDALVESRPDTLAIAQKLAAKAGQDIDIVNPGLLALAYHGQLGPLVQAMRIGWHTVQSSAKILPWAISRFAEKGVNFEIYDYLEHTSSPDPSDGVLLDRIKYFIPDPRLDYVAQFIGDLTDQGTRRWTVNDFALKPPRKKNRDDWDESENEGDEPPDAGALNLSRLVSQFVGYLRRVEGVPYPKGDLARDELYRYFIQRHQGELKPRLSMLDQALHPKKKLPPPPRPAHPLCPERVTFEVCLARMISLMNSQYHTLAALFESIPAWLRFLESQGLIDNERHAKTLDELRPLHAELLPLMKSYVDDPALYRALQAWPLHPGAG